MIVRTLTYADLDISPVEIYVQMGYGEATPDAQTKAETEVLIREIAAVVRPQLCFFITDGSLNTDRHILSVMGRDFAVGGIICRQLLKSQRYVLFVATAGQEFEAFQQNLAAEGDMVKVFIADAIGSVLAEKTADRMEKELENLLDSYGWYHTNRFSPGYCGWHVSEQQQLFPLFPEQPPCSVTLSESSLMSPIKSVSGIIGIGADVKKHPYSCGLCDYRHCYKRRHPRV